MSNPQTAQEWRAAAAALEKQREQSISNTADIQKSAIQFTQFAQDYQNKIRSVQNSLDDSNLSATQRADIKQYQEGLEKALGIIQSKISETNAKLEESKTKTNTLNEQYADALNQANKAEGGSEQTSTNTPPANSNPGPNTQVTEIQIPNVNSSSVPVEDTGVVQTFAVTSGNVITSPQTLPSPQISSSDSNQTAITQAPAATQYTIEVPSQTILPSSNASILDPDDPQNLLTNLQQYSTNNSATPISDEEYIARRQETSAIRGRASAISIADVEGVDTTQTQLKLAKDIRTGNVAGGTEQARSSANSVITGAVRSKDLRVTITLSQHSYFDIWEDPSNPGILEPLKSKYGVIFPYTPQITVSYTASYDTVEPAHSNYKIHNYKHSSVDAINIIGDFTAQDTREANYLLAVIHFFRSVTKMFYGKDQYPPRGTPPPLCYLSGHGAYGFNNHPIVISSFTLSYPNDVNYINAGAGYLKGGQLQQYNSPMFASNATAKQRLGGLFQSGSALTRLSRLKATGIEPGGVRAYTPYSGNVNNFNNITRVPTKMTITLQALPIITRSMVSNEFSWKDYASGRLLRGDINGKSGGFW